MLSQTKDQPLDLVVLRNGEKMSFTLKPVLDPGGAGQEPAYRIGIASRPTKVVKLNFSQALERSLSDNKKSSFLILELLQKMVQRKVSMRQVDGRSASAALLVLPRVRTAGVRFWALPPLSV